MTSDRIGAGQRLADTLRRIRESRGIDLADFIARTRAAPDIVEEFETNCLVDHPMYNRVYLRPFVREYADAVGLSPEKVLRAVDAALKGKYDPSLAVEFLGEEPGGDFVSTFPDDRTEETAAGEAQLPGVVAQSGIVTSALPSDTVIEQRPVRPKPGRAVGRSPDVPVRIRPSHLGIGLSVVVVLLLALWLWPSSEPAPELEPRTSLDTRAESVELTPRVVIGEVMKLWIIAVDTLNPVRVTVDDRQRAPYWIELGDSMSFDVSDRIVLEREVDQLALSYGGVRLPVSRGDSTGRLELTRQRVQELLDSLRTAR